MPTATQLANGCAGTFNPAQISATPLTLSRIHGLPRRSHAEGAAGPGFSPCLARTSRAAGGAPAKLPCSSPEHPGIRAWGRGDLQPQVTASDRTPAGRTPCGTRHEGGRLRPDSGLSSRGNQPAEGGPALLPVPPTATRARRPLGAGSRARPERANRSRSHPGEFKRTRGARPCPAARRTGKI